MASELDILTQVLISLKDDQNDVMNDIHALINNRNIEQGLISSIKNKVRRLSEIHADMQELEYFILQLTQEEIQKTQKNKESDDSSS